MPSIHQSIYFILNIILVYFYTDAVFRMYTYVQFYHYIYIFEKSRRSTSLIIIKNVYSAVRSLIIVNIFASGLSKNVWFYQNVFHSFIFNCHFRRYFLSMTKCSRCVNNFVNQIAMWLWLHYVIQCVTYQIDN